MKTWHYQILPSIVKADKLPYRWTKSTSFLPALLYLGIENTPQCKCQPIISREVVRSGGIMTRRVERDSDGGL